MHATPFQKGILSLVLVAMTSLSTFESWIGLRNGGTHRDVLLSSSIALLSVIGIILVWMNLVIRWNLHQTSEEGELRSNEAEKWRKENRPTIQTFRASIDQQFESWGLSPKEREVALLFVKGLSMHEAALVRKSTEMEIRQESMSIFAKSGLKDRKELSAYFLEELLGPRQSSLS